MTFALSFTPHGQLSATEARVLVSHKGSLYCGTGQWCEAAPKTAPQIIRLDAKDGNWQLETEFPLNPVDRIAVSCMAELHFPTANLTTLVCGFFGGSAVGVRNAPGQWSVTPIGDRRGQIRSFTAHVDNRTGVDMAFAGSDQGIFSGVYDTALPGEIMWAATPEIDILGWQLMAGGHPERVMSFAELNGVLYATIGQKIYRRNDGHPSSWTPVWTNPLPGVSQSGLRGMTVINGDLWIGVEGTEARVASVNPNTGESRTEYDLAGPKDRYGIIAYNDFCLFGGAVLAGIDGAGSDTGPARYLSLANGAWSKNEIPPVAPNPMVACRTICPSPFNAADVYFGGPDRNGKLGRNTAWIARYAP